MSKRYKAGILTASFDPLVDHGGILYTWGSNVSGQLGINNSGSYSSLFRTPQQVGTSYWSSVHIGPGRRHMGAIKTDGSMWLWGYNYSGELGKNTSYGGGQPYQFSSPIQIGSSTDWYQVACGYDSSGALKTNGTLWMWGKNANAGNIGDNTTVDRSSPVQIGSSTDWSKLYVGRNSTTGIKTNGTLWGWGRNNYGHFLGEPWPVGENRSSPIQLGSDTWTTVVNGSSGIFAGIRSDGLLFTCGHNSYGVLGINLAYGGSNNARSSPSQIGSSTWSDVSLGSATLGQHILGVQTNGTLWAWGRNEYGQLGVGNTQHRSSPTQVGALTNWSRVGGGALHSVASKTNGTLWAWGYNGYGITGNDDGTWQSSPVQVGTATNWSLFSTTYDSVIGLREY